jgi:hypothetical protein
MKKRRDGKRNLMAMSSLETSSHGQVIKARRARRGAPRGTARYSLSSLRLSSPRPLGARSRFGLALLLHGPPRSSSDNAACSSTYPDYHVAPTITATQVTSLASYPDLNHASTHPRLHRAVEGSPRYRRETAVLPFGCALNGSWIFRSDLGDGFSGAGTRGRIRPT